MKILQQFWTCYRRRPGMVLFYPGTAACVLAMTAASAAATAHYVNINSPAPAPPYTNWAGAATTIQDAVEAAAAGDEIVVTNGVYRTGGSALNGESNRVAITKPLRVQSVNGPEVTVICGEQPTNPRVRCVFLGADATLVGFTLTKGYAYEGGGVFCESLSSVISNCVLIRNGAGGGESRGGGVYGGTVKDCVLSLNSVYGSWTWGGAPMDPLEYWVGGAGAGAYGSTLSDCSQNGNYAEGGSGGGACNSILSNCTVTGSLAGYGGGAFRSVLNNCLLTSNNCYRFKASTTRKYPWVYYAGGVGGGAYCSSLTGCTLSNDGGVMGGSLRNCLISSNLYGAIGAELNNCTVVGNRGIGVSGYYWDEYIYGGVPDGTPAVLTNCIVYDNAESEGNYGWGSIFNYCCTVPFPTNGVGNFTNAPLFIDLEGGNLRLRSNSPCINAGWNRSVLPGADLDGNLRVVGGTVDVGAYEFQSPQSLLSYAWLQNAGLPTDGSADLLDSDSDGLNNWQEWRARTDPRDPTSALRMLGPVRGAPGITVRWQSVRGQTYSLERATSLAADPTFETIATNITGELDTTIYTDTNAVGPGPFFYRVGVP